ARRSRTSGGDPRARRDRDAPAPTSAASVPRRPAACRAAPVPSGADPSQGQTDEVRQRLCAQYAKGSRAAGLSAPRGPPTLPVSRLRSDLLEDRLEQLERREDVLAGKLARARRAARREGLLDRAVLLGV